MRISGLSIILRIPARTQIVKELWVTGRYGANVFVIDLATRKMTRTIRTGAAPHGAMIIDLAVPR